MAFVLGGVMFMFNLFMNTFSNDVRTNSTTTELLVELGPDDHLSEIESILEKYNAKAENSENAVNYQYFTQAVEISSQYNCRVTSDHSNP